MVVFKVTPVTFFVSDFNLSSCEFDKFTVTLWYYILILNQTQINLRLWLYNTLTDPCEKSKRVSLTSSMIKNVTVAADSRSRFPVKLFCCITFGSTSSACCLLKSIAIS